MIDPEDVTLTSAISALKIRRRAALVLCIGVLLSFVGASPATASALPTGDPDPADLVADVVVSVGTVDGATVEDLMRDLTALNGVLWVVPDGDPAAVPAPDLLVALQDGGTPSTVDAVVATVADREGGAAMSITGRALADAEIRSRLGSGTRLAAVVVAITVGLAVGWLVGPGQGLLSAVTVALSAWLAGAFAAQAAGPFDGSLATTAIPAVLAAVVITVWLLFRLLRWFEEPDGDDSADVIQRAVLAVGPDLVIALSGTAVTAIFLELLGPAHSAATVFFVGALIATVLTLAIVVPSMTALTAQPERHGLLALLTPAGRPGLRRVPTDVLGLPGSGGRPFPVGVLVGFGAFLAILALFSFGSTPETELFDEETVGAVDEATDGRPDPTNAIVARYADGTDQLAKTAWLQRVSELPSVGYVDTSSSRYVDGTAVEGAVGAVGPFAPLIDGDEAPRFAVIVPTVSGRGPAARALLDAVVSADAGLDAEVSGAPVDAGRADGRDRSLLWLTLITVTIVGAVGVFVVIGDLALAGVAAGLRLLSAAAAVGLAQLLSGAIAGAELQIIVLVIALLVGLYEIGFLRRVLLGHRHEPTDELLEGAAIDDGWPALAATAAVALSALGLAVTDLGAVRRLGILMAVAVVIELVVSMWLLRPAVLGSRSINHLASEPVRSALRALDGAGAGDDGAFQRLTVVVSNLLHAEFSFQSDPSTADVGRVFVPDTTLAHKADEHHENLADAGLRIVGRSPQLRHLRVINDIGSPVTVAVTVDHPQRQLVNGEGKIVGVRRAERRSVMLWMVEYPDGSHRISDSVELGALPLGAAEPVGTSAAPTMAAGVE